MNELEKQIAAAPGWSKWLAVSVVGMLAYAVAGEVGLSLIAIIVALAFRCRCKEPQ